jgi:hypothetical protein
MTGIATQGNLFKDYENFSKLVQSGNLICDEKGNFHVENCLIALIKKIVTVIFRDLFGFESRKQIGWAKGHVHVFDKLEQTHTELNKEALEGYLKTAKVVKQILKQNKSSKVQAALAELKARTIGLKYRLGSYYKENYDAENSRPDEPILKELLSVAEEWRKTQIAFKKNPGLTELQKDRLTTLAKRPKIAKLILQNQKLKDQFFEWSLIEKNPVDAFVQYPRTRERLVDIFLSEKISSYGGKENLIIEKVEKDGIFHKYLKLPFETDETVDKVHYVNILDEDKTVKLSHNYELTIGKIFQIFKDRKFVVGDVEYLHRENSKGGVIANWHGLKWGAWDPSLGKYHCIDFTDDLWIKNLRSFTEILTEEQAHERFYDINGKKLQFGPTDYVFSIIGTNEFEDANLVGSHSMLCIAVPQGDGTRKLYNLSKFVKEFPDPSKSLKQYVRVLFDAVEGAIQCPDENIFKAYRASGEIAWKYTEQETKVKLKKIADDYELMQKGELTFQFLKDNCTDWCFEVFDGNISEEEMKSFSMSIWDAKPDGMIEKILINLPPFLLKMFFRLLFFIMGPVGRKKKTKDGKEIEIKVSTHEPGPWDPKHKYMRTHPSKIIKVAAKSREAITVTA